MRQKLAIPVFFIMVMVVCRFLLQLFMARHLEARSVDSDDAWRIAYLASVPLLAAMLWPVLRSNGALLIEQLRPALLRPASVAAAIAVGLMMRLAFWGQAIGLATFGALSGAGPTSTAGPFFQFACPALPSMLLALLASALMTPVVEEITMRGLVLRGLLARGRVFALLASSVLFALFHPPPTMAFVFAAGVVLAGLALRSGSLWPCIIAHATYNGAILIDWVCLQGQWTPGADDPQLTELASLSVLMLAVALIGIVMLLRSRWLAPVKGASHLPGSV